MKKKKIFRKWINQNLKPLDNLECDTWMVELNPDGTPINQFHTDINQCTGMPGDYVGIHTECLVLDIDTYEECDYLQYLLDYTYSCKTDNGYHIFFLPNDNFFSGKFEIEKGKIKGDFRGQGKTFLYIKDKYTNKAIKPLPTELLKEFKANITEKEKELPTLILESDEHIQPHLIYNYLKLCRVIIQDDKLINEYKNIQENANNELNTLLFRLRNNKYMMEKIIKNKSNLIEFIEYMNNTMDNPIPEHILYKTILNPKKFA